MNHRRIFTYLLIIGLGLSPLAATGHAQGTPNPGWLGLGYLFQQAEPTTGTEKQSHWLYIHGTAPESPAEKAGLQPQDLIVEIDGEPVTFPDELAALEFFAAIKPGQELTFTVRRGPRTLEKSVRAVPLPTQLRDVWQANYERARRNAMDKKNNATSVHSSGTSHGRRP